VWISRITVRRKVFQKNTSAIAVSHAGQLLADDVPKCEIGCDPERGSDTQKQGDSRRLWSGYGRIFRIVDRWFGV
jgi:hypothetical protein